MVRLVVCESIRITSVVLLQKKVGLREDGLYSKEGRTYEMTMLEELGCQNQWRLRKSHISSAIQPFCKSLKSVFRTQ